MGGFRAAGVRFNYRGRAAFVEIRLSRDAGETRARERFPTLSPPPLLRLDYSRPKKTLESFAGKIRKIYNGHRSRERLITIFDSSRLNEPAIATLT